MEKPDRTVHWGKGMVICWWGAELQLLVLPQGGRYMQEIFNLKKKLKLHKMNLIHDS